ncbi:RnfH family protein [Alcaligenes sp. SDU_A2]|uniref:RnfH family protein n=1 Tax=Alcaligenes sp. SDU_A2 TaxID=3136634 RepID=UPI00311F1D51
MTELTVTVIIASQSQVWRAQLTLPAASSVRDALRQADVGIGLAQCGLPVQEPEALRVGVFGQRCELDQLLRDQDRVEIYRDLVFDPMESRRRRYAHKMAAPKAARPRRKTAAAAR